MTAETSITVIKRNKKKEPLEVEKFDKVCHWACESINGVSASELALRTYDKLYNNITTKEIHETLISTAADLITEKTPNYDKVASRLVNFGLRKEVYGSYEVPMYHDIVMDNIKRGVYTHEILNWYSGDQLKELSNVINSDRDDTLCFAGMEQLRRKYLVQDRSNGVVYETPQIRYGTVAATLFANENENERLGYVKRYYNIISQHKISIPTPVAAGVGTNVKQFSSCVLVPVGDSLDSINAGAVSIVKYVSKKAGIGVDMGHIRGEGAKVGQGEIKHTGVIPFIKYMKGALKSCSQGGVRGAAATVHYPWFHYEFGDMVVLKNNQGTEETRERHMDYSVQWNDYFLDSILPDDSREVSFFCPKDVPDLFDAFYAGDNEEFGRLYEKYERKRSIRKTTMSNGKTVLGTYLKEFAGTGRVYSQFMSAVVNQGPFNKVDGKKYWLSSNLCQEIALAIKDFGLYDLGEEGMIALCTLSSINWGVVNKVEDLEEPCRLSVRALDNLLDYQEYPVIQAERFTRRFRALGIGIIGLAHFLAKRDLGYNIDSAAVVDEYMEAMTYYLTDESVKLAEERGPCEWYKETCYGDGIFPWERRNKNIDKVVPHQTRFDWEELRVRMIKFGIRNATLMAIAPTESSSQLTGETNGIEPPVEKVTTKTSKDGALKIVVPEIHKLKNKYTYRWDMPNPKGYLVTMAVLQKWVDQSISVNLHYNPENYEEGKVPMSQLMKDFMLGRNLGIKNYYYCNTLDQETEEEEEIEQVVDEEECDSCVI